MMYQDPALRDLLAGEYVLGTMKPLVRARFERLLAQDAGLRRLVGEWEDRFAPVDAELAPVAPPGRLWRRIARSTAPPAPPFWQRIGVWRGLAGFTSVVALSLVAWVAWRPAPTARVLAVLNRQGGQPAWVALAEPNGRVRIADAGAVPADPAHDYELWAIAGGAPRPLGVMPHTGGPVTLPAGVVPEHGVLAVSLEPRGGSPTGAPTGPVVSQAHVLSGA